VGAAGNRKYTDQFKAEAVELVFSSGRPASQIARELGVNVYTMCNWVNMAKKRGQVEEKNEPLTVDERAELKELREENRRLKMEREILKKAAAWFAKESL
jgi:transposase